MDKKICLFVSLLLLGLTASAQELRFADMQWGSTKAEVQAQLGQQGFTNVVLDKDGDVTFDGVLLGYKTRGFALLANGQLQKVIVTILVPDRQAREKYRELKASLTQKYGAPEAYEFFSKPYFEGDGFEEQAIKVGKGTFASFWKNTTTKQALALEITDRLNLRVSYEGPGWVEESERRKKQQTKVF